jgi:hypothetical protein
MFHNSPVGVLHLSSLPEAQNLSHGLKNLFEGLQIQTASVKTQETKVG